MRSMIGAFVGMIVVALLTLVGSPAQAVATAMIYHNDEGGVSIYFDVLSDEPEAVTFLVRANGKEYTRTHSPGTSNEELLESATSYCVVVLNPETDEIYDELMDDGCDAQSYYDPGATIGLAATGADDGGDEAVIANDQDDSAQQANKSDSQTMNERLKTSNGLIFGLSVSVVALVGLAILLFIVVVVRSARQPRPSKDAFT